MYSKTNGIKTSGFWFPAGICNLRLLNSLNLYSFLYNKNKEQFSSTSKPDGSITFSLSLPPLFPFLLYSSSLPSQHGPKCVAYKDEYNYSTDLPKRD